MSYVRIWIHAVFATKYRESLLTDAVRPDLCEHMVENACKKQLFLDCVNGYHEHLHCLFQLSKARSVGETIQLLKGESSFWMNHDLNLPSQFGWQDDYFAVSVSESLAETVRRYIHRQEEHHRSHTFEEEAEAFGRKFGWDMGYFLGHRVPSAKADGKAGKPLLG